MLVTVKMELKRKRILCLFTVLFVILLSVGIYHSKYYSSWDCHASKPYTKVNSNTYQFNINTNSTANFYCTSWFSSKDDSCEEFLEEYDVSNLYCMEGKNETLLIPKEVLYTTIIVDMVLFLAFVIGMSCYLVLSVYKNDRV